MTVAGRDCPDVLLQIAAVQKALDNAAKLLLKDHLESCVVNAVHHGNQDQVIAELTKALDNYTLGCDMDEYINSRRRDESKTKDKNHTNIGDSSDDRKPTSNHCRLC